MSMNGQITDSYSKISYLQTDFQVVDIIDLQPGDNPISSAIDKVNGYIYFGSSGYPGRITRVRLDPFERVDSIGLNPGEDYPSGLIIDDIRGYLYFGTDDNPAKIIKIRLSDFTRVGEITTSIENIGTNAGIIDEISGFAYFGSWTTGEITKIDIKDPILSEVGKIQTSTEGIGGADIDIINGFAYFGGVQGGMPDIIKIDIKDPVFSEIANITFVNASDHYPWLTYIDEEEGYGYFVNLYFSGPNRVVKVNLSTFTEVTSIDGPIKGSYGGTIDKIRKFLYLGGDTGTIAKIDLSTFTKVDTITLESTERYPETAVIDEENGYVYFGIYPYSGNPPKVVKILIAQTTGNLNISSEPSEAIIYIDGEFKALLTPQTIEGLSEGEHTYKLIYSGYKESDGTFTTVAGETTYVHEVMEPIIEQVCPTPNYLWLLILGLGTGMVISKR